VIIRREVEREERERVVEEGNEDKWVHWWIGDSGVEEQRVTSVWD